MNSRPTDLPYSLATQLLKDEFNIVIQEFNLMDVFGYDANKDCCEIEIKCSDYDFHKEFTKPCKLAKHAAYQRSAALLEGFCPTRFYFMVPESFRLRAMNRINKTLWYKHYGLIVYSRFWNVCKIVKKSERLTEIPFDGTLPKKPHGCGEYKQVVI